MVMPRNHGIIPLPKKLRPVEKNLVGEDLMIGMPLIAIHKSPGHFAVPGHAAAVFIKRGQHPFRRIILMIHRQGRPDEGIMAALRDELAVGKALT